MDSIKEVSGAGGALSRVAPSLSCLSYQQSTPVHPMRREKVPNFYITHIYIFWMVLALISLSPAYSYSYATSSPVHSGCVKSMTWLPLIWSEFILGKVEEKHLSTLPSHTHYSWNQKHQTRGDIDQNICHSFRNAACPELLAFTLLTEIAFLESVIFVVCRAGHFEFWSHPKAQVAHLPHQNLAATVCDCPVQLTKAIFKLRRQLEMCRMAINWPHASS